MYDDYLGIPSNNHEIHENIVSKIKSVFELHEIKNSKIFDVEAIKHVCDISLPQTSDIESSFILHDLENYKILKTPKEKISILYL